MGKKQKVKPTVRLVKSFEHWGDKIIYEGTLKKAKSMIPPSKKDQFQIEFI